MMQGETVLITGAARRLGRATAIALAQHGAQVVVHYNHSAGEALALVHELKDMGVDAWAIQADLSDESRCQQLVNDSIRAAGRVEHLVNNASIFPRDTLDTMSTKSLEENIAVHTRAPHILGQGLYDVGSLKTVTNLLDTRVVDYDQQHVSYHLSKRMLMSLNSMMALEWAPQVRVNAVAPGLILPPEGLGQEYLEERAHTNPLQATGSEADITKAISFLMTSPFVTGQIIYVDGGRHLKGRVYE
jgi:pteridine reductase